MDNIARTHLFQEMIELNKAWFLCSQGTPRSVGVLVCTKYNKQISAEPLGGKFTSFQCEKGMCEQSGHRSQQTQLRCERGQTLTNIWREFSMGVGETLP